MNTRLRLNIPLLPILVLLTVVLAILDPSKIWTTLLVGLGGAWLLAYLWARSLARNLGLVREMRYGWAQVGDRLEERFTVINHSKFPASWVEVQDLSNLPGYRVSQATSVSGESTSQWLTDGTCTRRGLYTLGGTSLRSGDPLGIYTLSLDDPSSTTLLVMPPVVPLPLIAVTPGGYSDEGRARARAQEQTVGAASVREYQPGDSMRMIHWPSTARQGEVYVRLFDGTPGSNSWILLDIDGGVQSGEGANSTEEHGIILAASLADRALNNRQAVGLVINGQELTWIPPQKTVNQRWTLFKALALAKPGELKLAHLLQRAGQGLGQRSSLVIITASTQPDWLEALLPLTWRGITPTVLLLEPRSFEGSRDVAAVEELLQRMNINCHVIRPEVFQRPEASPGQLGQWKWQHGAIGHATAWQAPVDTDWRKLA